MRRHPAHASASARRGAAARTLRIIGGSWRGRRLRFPPSPEIRPTPDRVRETLFNWLAPRVPGARCLDLFAGSGALGLEALSRGAVHVTFVERDAAAACEIAARLEEWGAHAADVEQTDARGFLERTPPAAFDIVFLDPPFASPLLAQIAARLEHGGWLADDALIYVEYPADAAATTPAAGTGPRAVAAATFAPPATSAPSATSAPPVPSGWAPLKSKRAGEVGYHLYSRAERGDSIE